jgi:hypothetical protein
MLRKRCPFRYRKPLGHQTDLTKIDPLCNIFTLVKRDKEGHFMVIKEAIHQAEITISTYMHPRLVHPTSLNTY